MPVARNCSVAVLCTRCVLSVPGVSTRRTAGTEARSQTAANRATCAKPYASTAATGEGAPAWPEVHPVTGQAVGQSPAGASSGGASNARAAAQPSGTSR